MRLGRGEVFRPVEESGSFRCEHSRLGQQPVHAFGQKIEQARFAFSRHLLRGGGDNERLPFAAGALAGGIKFPYGFDFVAEKINSAGRVRIERIHVDQAPAHGELTGRLADDFAVVSELGRKCGGEFLEIEHLPNCEPELFAAHFPRVWTVLEEPAWRGREKQHCPILWRVVEVLDERGEGSQPVALPLEKARVVRFQFSNFRKHSGKNGIRFRIESSKELEVLCPVLNLFEIAPEEDGDGLTRLFAQSGIGKGGKGSSVDSGDEFVILLRFEVNRLHGRQIDF